MNLLARRAYFPRRSDYLLGRTNNSLDRRVIFSRRKAFLLNRNN